MSDTPRTDANLTRGQHFNSQGKHTNYEHVEADFARTLERELAEAKTLLNIHQVADHQSGVALLAACADRDRWQKMAEELASHLVRTADCPEAHEALSRFAITKSCHIIKSAWVP